MSTSSILDVIPDGQKYPYATPEQPNKLSDYDLQFLSLYTGQKDLDKLREHVLKVWRSLKDQVWVYRCIQELMFLQPRISRHPFYAQAKSALQADPSRPLLDIGCCLGQDTRQLILDGIPQSSIRATDITPQYWEFGKQLFSDAEKLKVGTAWGSFADPDYIKSGPLSPLKGRLGFAWAGAVLHVMTAAEVKAFAAHVHAMLAPTGVFFGTCVGQDPPGEWSETPTGKGKRYLHREDTLEALFREAGFSQVSIERDRERGAVERQQDISTFGNQKIVLIYTATKTHASRSPPSDTEIAAMERQQGISTFGREEILLFHAATK